MASQREQQQEETHFRVMRLLDEDPTISTREIASKVGISNGAAYYCVTALVDKGFVKLKNFARSKTRPAPLRTYAAWHSRQGGTDCFISRTQEA